ncbi:MAG TPA: exodeoxyribonuclease VII large subunit, partial [Limnochordia bacterium]|nr:exodeoxyribonuclease VII large subunit [Limnochordia bacterium]
MAGATLPDGDQAVYGVTELTRLVQSVLEADARLRRIWVKGELSNLKRHASGHWYFTLKDETSRLSCVMFRNRAGQVAFRPEDGQSVVAGGRLAVYEAGGAYQLYVDSLIPVGRGDLHLAFEQLKARLQEEGLFAAERKRPLPLLPRTVGVVTSPSGAAVRDIISVLRRRFANVDIVLSPAVVQGEAGPESVVQALARLVARGGVDVVIVGRGGGSLEELWTFNDERVARAIAACPLPVISAVGHETDFTIADFVADRRAPTPSVAAELAVPERERLETALTDLRERAEWALEKRLVDARTRLRQLEESGAFRRPLERVEWQRERLDGRLQRIEQACRALVQSAVHRLQLASGKLDSLSPLAVLGRGYAVARRDAEGEIVRSVAQAKRGERLDVIVADGRLHCRVEGSSGRGLFDPPPGAVRPATKPARPAPAEPNGAQPALPLGD